MTKFSLDNFSLQNKTIILTGAAGILGKTFAHSFASAKANLTLLDVEDSIFDLAAAIEKEHSGLKVKGYKVDLTNESEVISTIHSINEEFGSIDVLHNNAASKGSSLKEFLKEFEDYSYDTWKEVMSLNVDSMFLMAKEVGKYMKQQKSGGSIIQTSSIYGVYAPDQRIYEGSFYNGEAISSPAVYSTSKAAVIGLTKYLAGYWGKYNIRVNTLTPGGIESGQNKTFTEKYSYRVPLNRMGEDSDLVGALVYLASDASKYTTGQNIIIDGGLSVW